MSGESPDAVLYDSNGNMLAVQNATALPANTPGLMIAGSDGTNSRYITVDSSGRPILVGAGVAGTPAGGVLSIQGVSGGTSVPVTLTGGGDTTATGSLGALNATVPITLQGTNGIAMQLVAGTLVGTIVPEVSVDGGTTWVPTFFDDPSTGNKVSSIVFASNNTATTRTIVSTDGASNVRVRVSLYTSGTTTCNLRASSQTQPPVLYSGTAGGVLPPTVVQIGGTDGSNLRTMSTDTSGHPVIVGPGTAGAPSGGVVTIQGIASGTNVPVSQGTTPWTDNITQFGGTNLSTGIGAGGAGIPRVTVSNDSNILATQSGTWTVQPGNTQNTTAWLVQDSADGPVTPGAVASKSMLIGGQFNAALPTLTNTQQSAIQLDSSGRVLVGSIASALPTGANTIGAVTQASGPWTENLTQIAGNAVSTAASGVQKVGIVGNAGATLDSTLAVGAAPTDGLGILVQYNTTQPAPTNTQTVSLQSDQSGNMLEFPGVQIKAGDAWTSATTINTLQYPTGTATVGAPLGAMAILVQLDQTTTLTGGAVTFQGTYDGTNWITVPTAQVLNPQTFASLTNPYTFVANTNQPFLILLQGFQQIRLNLTTVITGTGSVTPNWTILSNSPLQSVQQGPAASLAGAWSTKITDATNGPVAVKPASTAAVAADPALVASLSPNAPATYYASVVALATAGAATDFFTISASSTNKVKIKYISISAGGSSTGQQDFVLVKRSTLDTGGTSSTVTAVPSDSGDAAATASVKSYTVNPTLGTLVGNVRSEHCVVGQTGGGSGASSKITIAWDFSVQSGAYKPPILASGSTEQYCINLNSGTIAGAAVDVSIMWTEE
jgi:hypothetical protein